MWYAIETGKKISDLSKGLRTCKFLKILASLEFEI